MKKTIALLLTLVLALGAMFSLSSCGQPAASDVQAVKDSGKLVVGVTVYPPMDYVDAESGEWVGFDAELAQMFAESLGVNCQIVIINWANKVAELNTNQIDLVWNGMTASDELGEKIDFSVAYAENYQVVVAKKGTAVTKDTVKNMSIAVEAGSAGAKVVKEQIGATTVNTNDNGQIGALSEVAAGTSQVAVVDLTFANGVVGKGEYADLEVIEGISYDDEIFAVGLRKGSDIKAELDAFLKAKYADGTMAELVEKYGGVALYEEGLK